MVCVDDTCYLYDINASCIICTFVSYAKPVMGDQRSTKCIKTITCGTRAVQIGLLQRCLGPRINWTDCSQFSMQQHDSSSPPVDEITWHCCFGNYTGFLFQNAWSLKCVPYCIAASTDSALPTCPVIWSPCPTSVHGRDCVLLPWRLWWFLLHGDLCLATALSQLPPRGPGMPYRTNSLWRRLCHHSSGYQRPTFSAVPLVLINFWDVSTRQQRLFLTMFRGLAVIALTPR